MESLTVVCARCAGPLENGECRSCVQFETDFGWLMKQPQFRRFFMALTDSTLWCGAGGLTFDLDHALSSYREGRRSVAIQLRLEAQRLAPKLYVRAVVEEVNSRADNDTTTENA